MLIESREKNVHNEFVFCIRFNSTVGELNDFSCFHSVIPPCGLFKFTKKSSIEKSLQIIKAFSESFQDGMDLLTKFFPHDFTGFSISIHDKFTTINSLALITHTSHFTHFHALHLDRKMCFFEKTSNLHTCSQAIQMLMRNFLERRIY